MLIPKVCNALKKEIECLEFNKSRMEIMKRSLELELGRSQRRCEELVERVLEMEEMNNKLWCEKLDVEEQLEKSEKKCEELMTQIVEANKRREEFKRKEIEVGPIKNIEITESDDKMRVERMESAKTAQLYEGRLHDPEPMMTNNADLVAADAMPLEIHDDSGGNGSSKKGANYGVILRRCCDLGIINKIKMCLGKENLKIFEQSCFGHFLKINQLQFQGQLISQLLLHMDMGASNKEGLVFKINNTNLEFGHDDFHRVTGLHFGAASEATTNFLIQEDDAFRFTSGVGLKYVAERFLEASHDDKGRDEAPLKWALLYFLYGTLLANRCDSKKIDLGHLQLFEDPYKYNTLPWGRLAFNFLVSSIFHARKGMDASEVIHKKKYIKIRGFVFALQIWAYEVMPCVAEHCASRTDNFESLSPQILRWTPKKKPILFDDLKKFFAPDDEIDLVDKGESERCSSSSSASSSCDGEDVMFRSESDDEMGKAKIGPGCGEELVVGWSRKRERTSIKSKKAAANQDSDDDESISDDHMNNLVAKLQRRTWPAAAM